MQPKIYTAEDHHIRDGLVDKDALFVLSTLHEAGFEAYLVGGGVRDLLMNHQPKDFDISTSASPEEIKKAFGRKCLLIGRRFRLAHIRFGKNIIEVATFRAGDQEQEELIVRDNEWGTAEEDVMRRDFTINGLYYDPLDHRIIDYVGGFEDLSKHLLRSIGKPATRFRQDPVRMIRALKFKARFDFNIEPDVLEAMKECKSEILKCAPARLLEELLRMLESGASKTFLDLLLEHEILQLLLPCVAEILQSELGNEVRLYLDKADEWVKADTPIPPQRAVLAASLLFPLLERGIKVAYLDQKRTPNLSEIHHLCGDLVDDTLFDVFARFTRRLCFNVVFALENQYRLTPLTKRRIRLERLIEHPDYRYALQFLRLRAMVNPDLRPVYEEWRDRAPVQEEQPRPRKRTRRRRKKR